MRLLGWAGKAQQAADLADAFHNLPTGMWQVDFNLQLFRDAFLVPYQQKYPQGRARDYVAMVDEIIATIA
jgi:aminoglycoside phosphotransferase